jgi:hypothetical protein
MFQDSHQGIALGWLRLGEEFFKLVYHQQIDLIFVGVLLHKGKGVPVVMERRTVINEVV